MPAIIVVLMTVAEPADEVEAGAEDDCTPTCADDVVESEPPAACTRTRLERFWPDGALGHRDPRARLRC